jgi:hypothetical protein
MRACFCKRPSENHIQSPVYPGLPAQRGRRTCPMGTAGVRKGQAEGGAGRREGEDRFVSAFSGSCENAWFGARLCGVRAGIGILYICLHELMAHI